MKKLLFILTFFFSCSSPQVKDLPIFEESKEADFPSAQALFFIERGKIEEACRLLIASKERRSETLSRLGQKLIEGGVKSGEPEEVLLSLYGVAISHHEDTERYVRRALSSPYPQLQLAAVQVLSALPTTTSTQLLEEALGSDFVIIRLEALFSLSERHAPSAFSNIDALFSKVDEEYRPMFCELYQKEGSLQSRKRLLELLHDQNPEVRLEAVLALKGFMSEEVVEQLLAIASCSPSSDIEEALASTLSESPLDDVLPPLSAIFSKGGAPALAAALRLHKEDFVIEEAKRDNLFALQLAGDELLCPDILINKLSSSDRNILLNASCALLTQKSSKGLETISSFLIRGPNDLILQRIPSSGHTFSYLQAIPSAHENLKSSPLAFEVSRRIREELLIGTLELPEEDFIDLARLIFKVGERDLIPTLCHLLENLRSEQAIALLEEESMRPGFPFIRAWCQLSLFRLGQMQQEDELFLWIKKNLSHEIIEMRPPLPWRVREEKSPYSIALEEKSTLLVEAFQALSQSKKEEALVLLLEAIKEGNIHNRPLLGGLLLSAIE
jgi:HEAT repeat protein